MPKPKPIHPNLITIISLFVLIFLSLFYILIQKGNKRLEQTKLTYKSQASEGSNCATSCLSGIPPRGGCKCNVIAPWCAAGFHCDQTANPPVCQPFGSPACSLVTTGEGTGEKKQQVNDDLFIVIDKNNPIPQSVKVRVSPRLVDVTAQASILTVFEKKQYVDKRMIPDLQEMVKNIKNNLTENIEIRIRSGYRSDEDQNYVQNNLEKMYGEELTSMSVAPVGYSEHGLGTAIDFASPENKNQLIGFQKTKFSQWLILNGVKYGFVMSYPEGFEYRTGYKYEPWHWRWIGKKIAAEWSEQWNGGQGATLNEWLRSR